MSSARTCWDQEAKFNGTTPNGHSQSPAVRASHLRASADANLRRQIRSESSKQGGTASSGSGLAAVGHSGPEPTRCPNTCGTRLSVPVYPTGREHCQLARRPQRVIHVYLFHEGPVAPNSDYVPHILEMCSPDALEDDLEIVAFALKTWPEDITITAAAHVMVMGKLAEAKVTTEAIFNGEAGTFIDRVNK